MAAGYAAALRDRVHREQEGPAPPGGPGRRAGRADAAAQPRRSASSGCAAPSRPPPRRSISGSASLDLDGFAAVNDALGHDLGDRLLVEVAARLHQVVAPHLVARTGGDEFAVLVDDPADPARSPRSGGRVQETLALPFRVGGRSVTLSASIGVAVASPATAGPAESCAGRGRRAVVGEGPGPRGRSRCSTRTATRASRPGPRCSPGCAAGVERGEFLLHYQPLVRLADGRVRGAEALVRWQHPEHGLLGPGRFVEAAERSGAIVPLGRWVLERGVPAGRGMVARAGAAGAVRQRQRLPGAAGRARLGGRGHAL